MSASRSSARPLSAATCIGVQPLLVGTVGDTPARRRDSHASREPRAHAQCIGSSP